jgi:hypothetical protein
MVESRVAPLTIRQVGSGLTEPRAVPALNEDRSKLGPLTRIRGVANDGTVTSWHEAGDLWLADAGLVRKPVRLGTLETARVSELDPDQVRWLEESKPREGWARVTTGFGVSTLHVWRPDGLIPWMGRFLARAQAAGKPLGRWELTDKAALGGLAAEPVEGGPLEIDPRALLAAGDGAGQLGVAHAILWSSADRAFELKYFDSAKSALVAIPLLPVILVLGIIYSAMGGGSFDSESGDDVTGGGPTLLLAPDVVARAQPLFTPSAQRRSFVTFVAAADAAATIQGDARASLSLSLRLTELLELGAFARGLTTAADGAGSTRATHLVAGGRMGLHLPLAPVSPWAITAGADVGADVTGHKLRMAGFYAGVRRAFGRASFIALHPLVPTWMSGDAGTTGSRFRWMPALEAGVAF